MKCPHCNKLIHNDAVVSEAARIHSAKRVTYGTGGGRPIKDDPVTEAKRAAHREAQRRYQAKKIKETR